MGGNGVVARNYCTSGHVQLPARESRVFTMILLGQTTLSASVPTTSLRSRRPIKQCLDIGCSCRTCVERARSHALTLQLGKFDTNWHVHGNPRATASPGGAGMVRVIRSAPGGSPSEQLPQLLRRRKHARPRNEPRRRTMDANRLRTVRPNRKAGGGIRSPRDFLSRIKRRTLNPTSWESWK
jgi:hypothetical protein